MITLPTYEMKIGTHLIKFIAHDFWNACHMSRKIKDDYFPQLEITDLTKISNDGQVDAYMYPFKRIGEDFADVI